MQFVESIRKEQRKYAVPVDRNSSCKRLGGEDKFNCQLCELGQLIQHLNFHILPPIGINDQVQGRYQYKEANSKDLIARKRVPNQKGKIRKESIQGYPLSKESSIAKTPQVKAKNKFVSVRKYLVFVNTFIRGVAIKVIPKCIVCPTP